MDTSADEAVVATNDDAAICKYNAVLKGYYKDSFVSHFLSNKAKSSSIKKAPEINRGYYARSASIAYLVEQFINENPSCQIISLGAGYDSLYWRLKSFYSNQNCSPQKQLTYVEIDMNVVTVHKLMAIRRHRELADLLSSVRYKGEGLHSDQYHLVSFDLRQVGKSTLEEKLFKDCQLDPSKPTLCITECVLVYMSNQDSSLLIQWLSNSFNNLSFLNYEQCNMKDRFGDIMLSNMNARQCDLMGVEACESLDTQMDRFKSHGLTHAMAWTLSDIFNKNLSPADVSRIEDIEFLDEKELLEQLLQHYCIVVASHKPLDWITDKQYWLANSL